MAEKRTPQMSTIVRKQGQPQANIVGRKVQQYGDKNFTERQSGIGTPFGRK